MIKVLKTEVYGEWLRGLRDAKTKIILEKRVRRLGLGDFGDCRSVGGGVIEARGHYGPGYRIYYGMPGEELIVLLVGGDKSTQRRDIRRAIRMNRELEEDDGEDTPQ